MLVDYRRTPRLQGTVNADDKKDIERIKKNRNRMGRLNFLADSLLLSFAVTSIRFVYSQIGWVDGPRLARQELGVDERNDTTLGNDHITQELVQSSRC